MGKYAVAYCNPNGSSFSDTEPWIKEAGNTIKDIKQTLKQLVNDGCCQLLQSSAESPLL